MRLIKLTSFESKKPIYINVERIGHITDVEERNYNNVPGGVGEKYTNIGVTTHRNGGFNVAESVDKVLKLIGESRGI